MAIAHRINFFLTSTASLCFWIRGELFVILLLFQIVKMNLLQQKEFLLNGSPVAILIGEEFSKKDDVTLTQQVVEYYNSIGNKAISPVYGEVILDKQSVEDDFAHGVGRAKAIAFAAVPNIIKNGIVILPLDNHKKDTKILSAMIAAPISIGDTNYIGVVVVRQYYSGNNKLYVHEVTLKEKILVNSSNPVLQANSQGINHLDSSSNPAQKPATNQGAIAKVLQKIISATI
ncbi:hypothetical protein FACS1894156_4990 [Bacteroidia bacterium]|nr:hypothetical protein FACS1894156_4990 [Bacteroidia bacterium]